MLRRHTTKNDRRTNIKRVSRNMSAVYNKPFTAQTLSHSPIQARTLLIINLLLKNIIGRGTQ